MSKLIKVSDRIHETLFSIKKTKGFNSVNEVIQDLLPLVTISTDGEYAVLSINGTEIYMDKDASKVIEEAFLTIKEARVI